MSFCSTPASGFSAPVSTKLLQRLPRPDRSVKGGREGGAILPHLLSLSPSVGSAWGLPHLLWSPPGTLSPDSWTAPSVKCHLIEIFPEQLTQNTSAILSTLILLSFFHRPSHILFIVCFSLPEFKLHISRDFVFTAISLAPKTMPGT